jgi:pimeloyl-ACP methyl ester carboxylesterase
MRPVFSSLKKGIQSEGATPSFTFTTILQMSVVSFAKKTLGVFHKPSVSQDNDKSPVRRNPSPREVWAAMPEDTFGVVNEPVALTGKIDGAAQMAQFVWGGYNSGVFGPVSIVPATLQEGDASTPVTLVSISGTEDVEGQATDVKTGFLASWMLPNQGLANAKHALMSTVPEGATLVLAGHSAGGLIAQQLAADPEIRQRYTVRSTVAFGSAMIHVGARAGEVHRVISYGDPVSRASLQAVLPFLAERSAFGDEAFAGRFPITLDEPLNGLRAHMKDYTDETNTELAKIDALGRRSPDVWASVSFEPSERLFFSSPLRSKKENG